MHTVIRTLVTSALLPCLVLLGSLPMTGCSGGKDEAKPASAESAEPTAAESAKVTAADPATPSAEVDELPQPPEYVTALPASVSERLNQRFTGDLEEMVKRRLVRIGVTFNRTHYFVDKGVQRGVAYEYGKLMEDELNKRRKTGNMKVFFFFVPLPRDQLMPALVEGRVDLVIAGITDRPELRKRVDFTNPTRKDVNEVVVSGPGAPAIATVDDLSGNEVYVRKSSSYHESLQAFNERLKASGKPAVSIRELPGNLEDDDVLEMVNAGLIKITVVDSYIAEFWKQAFADIVVHDAVALRTGASLAVAIRKDSPQLAAGLNGIIDKYGIGTTFGNMMQKRYYENTKFVKNAASEAELKKFQQIAELFKKYGDQYDMDYLLMAAQGFQESGLDHGVRSRVGAIGVMQVMPATGKELNVGDISQLDPNIHAGVKYMRWVMDEYFKDEPMTQLDKGLFAFASYNAGPGRIRQLRREAEKRGLDPNVWFGNVEIIASERIGRETVTYVSNIYKYYVAYRLVAEENERRKSLKKGLESAMTDSAR